MRRSIPKCDGYSVSQPAKMPRYCRARLRLFSIYAIRFLCCAALVSGAAPNAAAQATLKIDLDTVSIDGIFETESKTEIRAEVKNQTQKSISGIFHWSLTDATQKPIPGSAHSQPLKIPADSAVSISHSFQAGATGFYFAKVTFEADNKRHSERFRFGINPTAIASERSAEPDFEEFWTQTQGLLGKIKPQYRVIKQIESKNKELTLYEIEFHSFGNVRVGGWLEIPNTPGPHPCVLRLPGYGQNMKPLNKFNDLAVFSFNIRGHGNSQKDIPGKPNNFWVRGLEDKENYFYRGAFMDCLRAMEFLKIRPEIDNEKIAVWGGSQGGGLALATAAFDPAASYCVADIPFLVDWVNYFKLTRWPEMDQWIATSPDQDWKSVLKTMSYFDLLNLASQIECPVLTGIGLQDDVCPPTTIFSMFNRIQAPKTIVIYPKRKHSTGRQHPDLVWRTLRAHFNLKN
ncbi:MAG: acetylxylan esterase [Pirellulales bacterium]